MIIGRGSFSEVQSKLIRVTRNKDDFCCDACERKCTRCAII